MTVPRGETLLIAAGLAYLVGLSWAMTHLSFDIWGAFILVPIYGALGGLGLHGMFRGDLRPVATVMTWGLLIKLGGAMARYWVGFEAYGGGIDAGKYHSIAVRQAGEVWAGERSFFEVLPAGTGTVFVEHFTSFTYMLTGGSKLAGFVTFSFLAYWGLALMVKAAAIAVPGMALRKYAWLCVLCPSLVYWPSSIGKEALMMLALGIGTYGVARLLSLRAWSTSVVAIALGVGVAAVIRPHMAGIWVASALPALVLAVVLGARSETAAHSRKRVSRLGLVGVIVIATVSLTVIAQATLKYLEPRKDDPTSGAVTEILNETTRRTAQAGSNFVPPSIANPTDWPFAVIRTLTRPLPNEVSGLAQLMSAAEMTALLGLYALSWRRVRALPKMLVTNPYVAFAMTSVFLSALAFASFANLGVLARQKSLIFAFLLLVPCLPSVERKAKAPRPDLRDDARVAIEAARAPSVVAQSVVAQRPSPPDRPRPLRRSPASNREAIDDDLWS